MSSYGFIITRHVNSQITNKYWNRCVKCIRRFYPFKQIIIIDDNSNQEFIKADFEYNNVEIIQSEFIGRGEILPYYYFHKYHYFDNAIIIHDSVFFHKRISFEKLIGLKVLPLWHFNSDKENYENTLKISNYLKNSYKIKTQISLNETVLGLNHLKWYGCFGIQSFINHTFLKYIEQQYSIFNILKIVKTRPDRCCCERIFGIIFNIESPNLCKIKSLLGNIYTYQKWGYSYKEYENDINQKQIPKYIIKIWTGR
jgi:hypothetical protein